MPNFRPMEESDLRFIADVNAKEMLELAMQDPTKQVQVGESTYAEADDGDFYVYTINGQQVHKWFGY